MDKQLKEDLESIKIPFDLLSAFQSVITELEKKKFKYDSFTNDNEYILTFKKGKTERVLIAIQQEHLYIRQYDYKNNKRSLKVLYVVKPSERNFKLL